MDIALYILIALFVLFVFPTMLVSFFIFRALLVRRSKEGWDRQPSMPDDEEYCRLYADAVAWRERNAGIRQEVSIENDGYGLFAEYYDFGGKNAVIMLPGRMEACTYSCHYAEPYGRMGWNVLTIDARAHGRSDGRLSYLGYKECRDVIAWANFLRERFGIEKIVLHGICIGSSAALFAATSKDCPDIIRGMVADGMYQCFYDSCKNHMLLDKRPTFPFLMGIMLWIRLICGIDAKNDGPKRRIGSMHLPILFLHSREDLFSTPDKALELFNACPSKQKSITWFERGWHSRLRLTDPQRYDDAVSGFIKTI